MNRYETVFVISPQLSEDQAKEVNKKYGKILRDSGAQILHQEHWNGYNFLYEYESEASLVKELEATFKRDDRVLRHQTVRLDRSGNKDSNDLK